MRRAARYRQSGATVCSRRVSFCVTAPSSGLCRAGVGAGAGTSQLVTCQTCVLAPSTSSFYAWVPLFFSFFFLLSFSVSWFCPRAFPLSCLAWPCLAFPAPHLARIPCWGVSKLPITQSVSVSIHQQPRLQTDNSHHVTTSPSAPLSLASFLVLDLQFIWGNIHDPVHLQIPSFVEKGHSQPCLLFL